MNDLISRQALLAEYDRQHVGKPGKARKLIENAPSVTICNDSDLISRKAAIDALRNAQRLVFAFGYHNALDAIFDLPSAQQSGKQEMRGR